MIGDVLLECTLDEAPGRTIAGFENHAGRTVLDPGAEPLGRVVAGYGNDGASGFEGCRVGRAVGHLPSRPAPATQPLARRPAALLGRRPCDRRAIRRPSPPLHDELEDGGSCRRRRPRTKPRRAARLTRYSAQRAPR